jgi:4'-phosphopantetheinyl transferase EntD
MADFSAAEVSRALTALEVPDLHLRVSELHGDLSGLAPEERMLATGVADSRRRELATGRGLARAALAELGFRDHVLLPDPERVPRWPEGMVGSLAHTRQLCALALGRRDRIRAVGLDLEDDAPLESTLFGEVLTRAELVAVSRRPSADRGRLARLLFSAKECVHKAQYPEARVPLEFGDVEIELDLDHGRFVARSARALGRLARAGESLVGRCARAGGTLVTLLALPEAGAARS